MRQTFITTSWDDGHPLDERLADMLARHNLAGTFYIPRALSTGVMSDNQIRNLATRFEIGAHTLNHVFLAETDNATANREIAGSKTWVQDVTGNDCTMFCPPAGRYTRQHLPMFTAAGYRGIRSVEFLSLDPPRTGHNLLEMPTTLQAFRHPLKAYVKNALKRRRFANLWLLAAHGRSSEWRTLAQQLLDRAIAVGGVFHLWGHSWEIEACGLWEELEQVLQLLGEAVAANKATCLTNGQLCQRQV
jgi:peptidoglycan/xylan/chitin deacetylase (PgdA/CDA1 family)